MPTSEQGSAERYPGTSSRSHRFHRPIAGFDVFTSEGTLALSTGTYVPVVLQTLDFRSVYATVLGHVLGSDPDAALLDAKVRTLPLFR